jgi:hypothetical protein
MVDWLHFLFQTAALLSGLASLFVVRLGGKQKEALRSIQHSPSNRPHTSVPEFPIFEETLGDR